MEGGVLFKYLNPSEVFLNAAGMLVCFLWVHAQDGWLQKHTPRSLT